MIKHENKLAALLILLAVHLALGLGVYMNGFSGASGDDFFRALMAYEWRQAPHVTSDSFGLCSILWFPTHFWITGFLYMISGKLALTLTIVSVLFSLAGLLLLYRVAEELFGGACGFFTVLLVVFIPWHLWLSISMTDMTLFFSAVIGAFLFLVKWEREGRPNHLSAAALLFMAATMFRPEAWIFAVLFSARASMELIRRRRQTPGIIRAIFAVLIPGVFILFWLGRNYIEFGDPLYFIHASKAHIEANVDVASIRTWIKGVKYPFLMLLVSPMLFVLTLSGLLIRRPPSNGIRRRYCLIVLAQLGMLMAASMYGVGTRAAPQRYVMMHVLLLSPFAGRALSLLWGKKRGLAVALMCVYIGFGAFKSFHPPSGYGDAREVGLYLKERFAAGDLGPGDRVCSEISLRRLTGRYMTSDAEFSKLAASHAALAAHSEHPRAFPVNILTLEQGELMGRGEPIGLSADANSVASWLRETNVTTVVLESRELMDEIPRDFILEKMVGAWGIFSLRTGHETPEWPDIEFHEETVFMNAPLGRGIFLAGFAYRGGFSSRRLILYWRIEGLSEKRDSRLTMAFTNLRTPGISFERTVTPVFHWRESGDIHNDFTMEDAVPLTLPPSAPSGDYSLTITLTEAPTSQFGKGRAVDISHAPVDLPTVTLVSSKRDVLIDCAKGHCPDWQLAAKILLAL